VANFLTLFPHLAPDAKKLVLALGVGDIQSTASLQFRWLAQPLPHGLFVGEILVFLMFKGWLTKHANHGMRQDVVHNPTQLKKASERPSEEMRLTRLTTYI
jgi:hypothetical protein